MADKTQLGTSKRIREKMTMLSQLKHDISRLNDAADPAHSTERRVQEAERSRQEAEKSRQEAEKKSQDVEKRFQEAERKYEKAERSREEAERGREEAEQNREEAERGREEAERRSDEAERGREQAERRFQEVERGREEAERSRREAESRVQELERRLEESDQHWLIQRREIHMTDKLLGGGGWGEVKIANFRGVQVAAKVIYKDLQSPYYHRAFIREMNMASRVRHPNLVQFIGASMYEEMVILMELMPTSLRQHLTSNAPAIPSAAFRISVSLDVARALNYLHLMQPHPIIHRDISSANILLEPLTNEKWRAKVTDYGSVNLQNRLKTENPGNPVYSAPEAHIPSRQTTKMDVFSFGVLLIEMCTAQFPDDDKQTTMIDIIRDRRWVEMIQQCTHQDQTQRPLMSQIITRLQNTPELFFE